MDAYIKFNLIEGLFWIFLGILSFIAPRKFPAFRIWAIFSGFTVLLFGISDFVEIQFGSFLEPNLWWLLVWKVLGVLGLIISVIWYLRLRIAPKQSLK